MTEPTAEQVREAHDLLCPFGGHAYTREGGLVCTALARVRIEAHAAGRDEGIGASERLALAMAVAHAKGYGPGFVSTKALDGLADTIRALRGKP